MTTRQLIAAIKANTYFTDRPPVWMLKNRDYLRLVRRLVQRIEEHIPCGEIT